MKVIYLLVSFSIFFLLISISQGKMNHPCHHNGLDLEHDLVEIEEESDNSENNNIRSRDDKSKKR